VFGALTHPLAGLHESSVQTLLSSQFGAAPPTHCPPEHVSPVVQAFPSSHGSPFGALTHPLAGLHESSVQTLLSLQFGAAPPTHDPLAHVSLVVQALPSSHGAVFGAKTHPLAGLHESSVQPLLSLQVTGAPGAHVPLEHVSPEVQALPSLHG
jgi:hypothetical protein